MQLLQQYIDLVVSISSHLYVCVLQSRPSNTNANKLYWHSDTKFRPQSKESQKIRMVWEEREFRELSMLAL